MRRSIVALLAVALAALACAAVWPAFDKPVHWTLDGFFYQARVLEFRGVDESVALDRVFEGPMSAELRTHDPAHTGNPGGQSTSRSTSAGRPSPSPPPPFTRPQERSLLNVSLAGYVAAMLALFGLLLLRFRVAIARRHARDHLPAAADPPSSYPITDSWGSRSDRRPRRRDPGAGSLAALVAVVDRSGPAPRFHARQHLDSGARRPWGAFHYWSRVPVTLFATGLAAALPPVILFQPPVRESPGSSPVNDSEPSADTSWGFILSHYPVAVAGARPLQHRAAPT